MGIGASEYKRKVSTLIVGASGGGAPAQKLAVCLAGVEGLKQFSLKNMGDEAVSYEILARGRSVIVTGESIAALRVAATDQFQGLIANTKITPGTWSATDAGGATQKVVDDGLGNVKNAVTPFQTVGTINYETGYINFTWMAPFVGAGVTTAYTHTGWKAFATPITGSLLQGGGESEIILMKAAGVAPADNYVDGIKGMKYVGIMAYSAGQGSMMRVEAVHVGIDTEFKLVPDFRFHNENMEPRA
jgi:hypothetical protein